MTESTIQLTSIDSKDGKAFLRRVVRHNAGCTWNEEWRAYAGPRTEWRLSFMRTIKGETGSPDQSVDVLTDCVVRQPGERKLGVVKTFDDCDGVQVCTPRGLHLGQTDAATVAKMICEGSKLSIRASAGSTHSSKHGLAFYTLEVTVPGMNYASVDIGGVTVSKDGQALIRAAVDL